MLPQVLVMVATPTRYAPYSDGVRVGPVIPGTLAEMRGYPGVTIDVWRVEEQEFPVLLADVVRGLDS